MDPDASRGLDRIKTEARRLVSLLHTQTGVSLERVSSTVDRLVELTSLLGVDDLYHGKPSAASPSEDRADPEVSRAGPRARGREPESEEAPAEDPQGEDLSDDNWAG